jgi:hypothetical protein
MPRRSKDALTVVHIGPGARRLEPPPELPGRVAEIFRQTVASTPHDHFQPEDVHLLSAYSQTVALAETAAAELSAHPLIDGKVSAWLAIQRDQVRLLAVLSMRLKLGPKSRRPDGRRATKPTVPPSYYDLHRAPRPVREKIRGDASGEALRDRSRGNDACDQARERASAG